MLSDWSTGLETRNYKIPHRPDKRSVSTLLANMCCIMMVALTLIGYVAIRSRIISLGYEIQDVKRDEIALERTQAALIVEEERLASPERIDLIARNDLGMEPLAPYQRVIPRFRELGREALAMANAHPEPVQPRRPSSNNN